MNAAQDGLPVAPGIIDIAILWYVRQASGEMNASEQDELARWLARHPDHARAWRQLQRMGEQLHGGTPRLAPSLARSVLGRLPDLERRKVLRLLSWAAIGGTSLYFGRGVLNEAAFPADYRTAVGERREVRLADGSLLQLNTGSAVDIRFDGSTRRIHLRRGEIQVVTAKDPSGRPLWIEGRDGRLAPAGTRFTVDQTDSHTYLGVSEGAVDVFRDGSAEPQRVGSGQQLVFGGDGSNTVQPLDESRHAWTDGMISAENRRLDDLLAELGRYRPGHLGCTPEAGALRITGTWPLRGGDPTEAVLASLERRLPIRIQRMTRYWVKVSHG
ncbi:FecR domain-containing protein [Thauera linaloolentis]|uniref:Transmembrane sensor n=1 Tax=Thauera linaloolentis (strain DSM 12138 / JCM 21573 / CCUG 41526 / CIP 105981 / IAM 15112 / NBRC 102519 / 47Lol) TaxID=1123367 RepID=N6Y871_THAL4|nr:FecR domain-containing protein [Thauera linaloolentis]ENO90456.1 transmembrane sensor [Thauera linaloolentis 47Lol = DSM 12138]MCM8566316.1 FecR domain-containing protein [Thauera linaloolentis]